MQLDKSKFMFWLISQWPNVQMRHDAARISSVDTVLSEEEMEAAKVHGYMCTRLLKNLFESFYQLKPFSVRN